MLDFLALFRQHRFRMSPTEHRLPLSRASSTELSLGLKALLLALAVGASCLLPALSQTNPPPVAPATNSATGPTIRLDYNSNKSSENPVGAFMYFVPLISTEPVSSVTSPGNNQRARVLSAKRKGTRDSFAVTCDWEFAGDGFQQSILDLEPTIRRQEQRLKAGKSSGLVLSLISVIGPGRGTVEIEGSISNNVETVTAVRLRFNAHGKPSPIAIELCELCYKEGQIQHINEMVARVNALTFRRKPGRPKMEVSLATVNKKGAKSGLWQSFKGSVVGMAVNLLIPPVPVEEVGHDAMLDFGQALASGATTFTFPHARNLK